MEACSEHGSPKSCTREECRHGLVWGQDAVVKSVHAELSEDKSGLPRRREKNREKNMEKEEKSKRMDRLQFQRIHQGQFDGHY